jgi:Mn2+/Fe2+ NRAMP family transporter
VYVQVFILDSLATYQCQDLKEAEKIAERVMPRLQHVNSAVVLSAIKVGVCVCVCVTAAACELCCRAVCHQVVCVCGVCNFVVCIMKVFVAWTNLLAPFISLYAKRMCIKRA